MFQFIAYPSWISPYVIPGMPIRWYSVMYLVAFAVTFILFIKQRNKGLIKISNDDAYTLFLFTITGLILGARLFSTLFYDGTLYYWKHPWLIFWPFSNGQFVGLPGMSYHGGLVGAVAGAMLFAKRYKMKFLSIADTLVAGIPLGYTFGRLGNFINGELWGRVSTAPWAIVFPRAPSFSTNYEWVRNIADAVGIEYISGAMVNLPRHPSQLYEALFEGVILWAFLWFFMRKRDKFPGYTLSWYLIGYGSVRFLIEYLREPDSNLGFILSLGAQTEPTALFLSPFNISMGQLLSFAMILAGILMLVIWGKHSIDVTAPVVPQSVHKPRHKKKKKKHK
ncbi:prolipoprotein diacylglyceryl transferase [Pleomorphochaeta sp. DL1XJH-081]|uniref:prolipoprotein diacylglyceryl transferase n=1 Tax=Pleomorphochaeta sp. DL1XJH-081 TaxID=3409690 RepID=UPI003BB76DA2